MEVCTADAASYLRHNECFLVVMRWYTRQSGSDTLSGLFLEVHAIILSGSICLLDSLPEKLYSRAFEVPLS
jgi:hypothetical protein